MDIARWFLGVDHLSPRVFSVGGRLGYEDDGETPNTQAIFHDYGEASLIFEVRGLTAGKDKKGMDEYQGVSIGNVVECEGGRVVVSNRYGSALVQDRDGKTVEEFKGNVDHFENFIQAVRSRKVSDLHADIWEGHLSSALCHTGNISHRVGAASDPNIIRESIKDDRDAIPTYERMAEHLEANGVNIEKDRLTLGPVLHMDPRTETFFGHRQANALLRREYRPPFVVPEHV